MNRVRGGLACALSPGAIPPPGPVLSGEHGRIKAMQSKRDGLIPVAEVVSGLDGPVKKLRDATPQAVHHFTRFDQVNQLIEASEADPDLGFMARMMALCSLPRTNPGNRIRYIRQNGSYTLVMTAGGIDGSVEVAPTALDTNVGLIDAPGPVGWLEMTAQPLLQFRTIALDPAPDCRVVRLQAAFAEQLFDIAERERVPQVPAHGAKNQLGLGLPPLEDRRSDCLFHDLFRLPAAVRQSCNTTGSRRRNRAILRHRTITYFIVLCKGVSSRSFPQARPTHLI